MASETEEFVMLVKKPNSTSMVWNYFNLEVNEQGTQKPGKDITPVCQSSRKDVPAKGGNTRKLTVQLKEHHTGLCIEEVSAQKSRDRVTKGKNAAESDGTSTNTNKKVVCHSSENTKEVLLANIKYTANSPLATELNKAVTDFIAKDAQPFSVAEKMMISKLNPRYQLPS